MPSRGSRAQKESPDYAKRPYISGFGVEVECGSRRDGREIRRTMDDPRFQLCGDGSIHGMPGYAKIEAKFGPMRGPEPYDMEGAIDEFRAMFKKFETASGGLAVNSSCGLHIHVGITNKAGERIGEWWNNRRLMRLLRSWRYFEPVFQSMVPRRRRNNYYCAPMRQVRIGDIRSGNIGRYYTMNFMSLSERGTIEFRLPNGTVDVEEIVDWIKVILAFMNMAFAVPLRQQAGESRPTPRERGQFLMAMLGPVEREFVKKRVRRYRWVPPTALPAVREMEFFVGQESAV